MSALDIGDSVSIQYTVHARKDLCGQVTLQHDAGDAADNKPDSDPKSCTHSQLTVNNNGCSSGGVVQVASHLAMWHYNVIVFNFGLHDMQRGSTFWQKPNNLSFACGSLTPEEYGQNIETLADILSYHADIVIWVDTTPVHADIRENIPADAQNTFNPVAEAVAKKHGFYVLQLTDVLENPNDIHLSSEGSSRAGQQLAACILTALSRQDTAYCHR